LTWRCALSQPPQTTLANISAQTTAPSAAGTAPTAAVPASITGCQQSDSELVNNVWTDSTYCVIYPSAVIQTSWFSAQQWCYFNQAELASMTTPREQAIVASILSTAPGDRFYNSDVWIGGSSTGGGSWAWWSPFNTTNYCELF